MPLEVKMSVFADIKKQLNIAEDDPSFDTEILMDINLVMAKLYEIGACDAVTEIDKDTAWEGLFNSDEITQIAKLYIYVEVKPLFDPTSLNSSTMKAFEEKAKEYEWRIYAVNNGKKE